MEPALKITNLVKKYGETTAVDDVSLTVAAGEFFAFLGPNGAGKTTTIGCVTGLTSITGGTIEVFGQDVVKDYRAARRLVGLAPQDYNFDIFRTPREILLYNAGYFGIAPKKARARADELLERFALTEHQTKPVNKLSGGMKRRLTLARALMHEPKLLILDEPTAGVDLELRLSLWKELQDIKTKGTTIILTTHYIEEAEKLCERVAIINLGKLVVVENTAELRRQHSDQKLEDIFLKLTKAEPNN
jgi:ABC-2 type transport system ATP-binding protein